MKYILFLLSAIVLSAQPSNADYRSFIQEAEGYRNIPYKDPGAPVMVVGIGHAFRATDSVKAYYFDWEINEFFQSDLNTAKADTNKLFPSFNNQPKEIQLVLVSMSFNLGYSRLSKFFKFRKAIESFQYDLAAKELIDSKWFRQTGKRGERYAAICKQVDRRNKLKNLQK